MRNCAGKSATRPTAGTQAGDGKRLPAVSTATRTRGASACRADNVECREYIDMGERSASAPRSGERVDGLVRLGGSVRATVMGG